MISLRTVCGFALALMILSGCGGGGSSSAAATQPSPPPPTTNSPPTISGTPAGSVTVGQAYTFTPAASDSDGDKLTFSITNAPSWATFDASTGRLSGTPQAANVATYSNITITVSDGTSTAALTAFSITVNAAAAATGSATLSWTPPTTNSDGSALTNLAGYTIHYGTDASSLSQTVQIANPGIATYVVTGLSSGTWYFAVAAYTSTGLDSALSSVVSKTIS